MNVSRAALTLAQTPAPARVYADDGVYAGIVHPDGRWECGSCLDAGVGGRGGLLMHDATHEGDPS